MINVFSCYHLPQSENVTKEEVEASLETLTFSNHGRELQLKVPKLSGEQLSKITLEIKKNRSEYLQHLKVNEIVDLLEQAINKWLDPDYELRKLAEEMLPIITGYDQEMVRLFLSRYLRHFRKEKLQRIIDQDFPNPLVLDEFRPRLAGGLYRAYGPELATHIFSGNVPALPLWSMVSGLIVKSATLGKVSSSEPLFPVLFAKTLEELEPRLAQSIAILWWKGGNEELEEVAFRESEAVIAYGSEQTTKQIAMRVPSGVRLLIHGQKISFGVITNESLEGTKAHETARLAAHDTSWFDQQGCLSPHVFYVEQGGKISAKDFARMLAHEMANFEHKMPRAKLSTEENNAILKVRSQAEFQSYGSEQIELLSSEGGTAWTVIYREDVAFPFSVLNRVVTVIPIENIEELQLKISDVKHVVQTVGVACPPQKLRPLINLLGSNGVNRICALGQMPQPEPGWHHDGRFNLADLVRWCDIESSVELQMDKYDPYRD
jgi:hypothetical protein